MKKICLAGVILSFGIFLFGSSSAFSADELKFVCNEAVKKISNRTEIESRLIAHSPTTSDQLVFLLWDKADLQRVQTYQKLKRWMDVAVTAATLPVTIFIISGAALAIKIEGILNPRAKGNVFFRQTRMGKDGKPFMIVKLRTMVANANKTGPDYTLSRDSRVTPLGRMLRRLKIDEVPQLLFNILLKNDMSLVGPRPLALTTNQECAEKSCLWNLRYQALPGLTGRAQVEMHDAKTVDEQLHRSEYDIYPIIKSSVYEDMKILFKTVTTIFIGKVSP
ncbi:MAG: polyprenyl glycosylphosphotransferase [Bacteriovoracaceae bacterium]|nr:polyprenyl glycosylphosphotransferase [Bacteriovoracaceae bacterium]